MYKRLTVDQLTKIQTKFFDNINQIMKKERLPLFKQFLRKCHTIGHTSTWFTSGSPILRIKKDGDGYIIIDEVEKIEIHCNSDDITKLHSLLKNRSKIKKMHKQNKSIMKTLWDKFENGEYRTIHDKPYLVYDIETTYASKDLRQCKWIIGYMIDTSKQKPKFQYISPTGYKRFFDYLLNYEGYIVGFNHIGFDNPVTAYNSGGTEEQIDILNRKSIDPFLFLWHMTGKRIGLNRASQALVGVTKTLESGAEAEVLYNKFLNEGDEGAMKELKKYCRNDVKMTLLLFLYLMDYQSIYFDEEHKKFELEDLITKGNIPMQITDEENIAKNKKGMFS